MTCDQRFDAADDRLAPLADGGQRDAEEQREDDDRQDLVGRSSPRRSTAGTTWLTKSLRLNAGGFDAACGRRRRDRQVEADARLKQRDEDQAERQRDEAREDEPAERADADPAERGDVAHVGDARDQRREDERRNDHLDQAQEQRGDDAEIVGDRLELRGARRRAVVDRGS